MVSRNKRFEGKVALITGASRGFGLSLSEAFWREGASLALLSRNLSGLKKSKNEYFVTDGVNQNILFISRDLSNVSTTQDIIEEVVNNLGRLDILVNNASVLGPVGLCWENDWNYWETTIRVNLLAPVCLCNAAVRRMKEKKCGKIINLSGGGATAPRPNFTAYSTAKAGLVRFSETLAEEVKKYGIDVNCIAPGIMNTEMVRQVVDFGPGLAGEKEYLEAAKSIESLDANMERAVKLVLFLASQESDGITGRLISAVWDPWEKLPWYIEDLGASDIYTLRRIVPGDRGFDWGA